MRRCKRMMACLMTFLAGAAPLAINATCDPRTGAFYFDRYDDRDFGIFDFLVDDYYYDDAYGGDIVIYDDYWF